MLVLLIETCTERSEVTLFEDDHCLYFAGLPFGLHNSRYVVPKIEEGFHIIRKEPKHLDVRFPNERKIPVLAIYERKGKTLKICLRRSIYSGKGRPTEYKTTPGSELILMVFSLQEE